MLNLKFLTGIVIGVAAGAAIVYFFGTEEGKELRSKLYDGVSDLEKELRKDFEELALEA
ncbi:MAG TPA: YtxH domain-containing protein [Chitinophagaceae bacterium]